MKRSIRFLLLVISSFLALPLWAKETEVKQASPVQQYRALLKEYRPVSVGMRAAKTDADRKTSVEGFYAFAERFVALAETHSQDPIAPQIARQAIQTLASADSLAQVAWETNASEFPTGAPHGKLADRIVALLQSEHLLSNGDLLGPIIDRMRYTYRMPFASFLGRVLKENPHRDVQGQACLARARFLTDRLQMIQLASDRPALAQCYGLVFGPAYLRELQNRGQDSLSEEIEDLLQRGIDAFADVKIGTDATVGELAKSDLYAMRHLSPGKSAPNIEGKDQTGETFALADYRGKVVLLYFWNEY